MDELASPPRSLRRPQAWATQPERGNQQFWCTLGTLSLKCGRSLSRIGVVLIVAYYWLRPGAAAGHIARYQRRALERRPTRRDLFSQLLAFATCLHDRVFMANNQLADFSVEISNEALLVRALQTGSGCLLMGAHIGSFEVIRAIGLQHPGVEVAMAMYPENARNVAAVIAAINPRAAPDIIPLGSIDAMLQVRDRLDNGAFVGILGDRTLADEPVLSLEFLGSPTGFPIGPWRAAALLRRPVLFVAGLYCGGNRYRIVVEELADFSDSEAPPTESAIYEAMARYAGLLETLCRSHPYNWFNFFDFWREQPGASPG